jgi:hypothetical protein
MSLRICCSDGTAPLSASGCPLARALAPEAEGITIAFELGRGSPLIPAAILLTSRPRLCGTARNKGRSASPVWRDPSASSSNAGRRPRWLLPGKRLRRALASRRGSRAASKHFEDSRNRGKAGPLPHRERRPPGKMPTFGDYRVPSPGQEQDPLSVRHEHLAHLAESPSCAAGRADADPPAGDAGHARGRKQAVLQLLAGGHDSAVRRPRVFELPARR